MTRPAKELKYKDFPKEKHTLLRAILNFGGNPSAFATALGIHQNKVYTWINSKFVAPPAQYCRKIEQLTGGEVTCEQLRPDVFGPTLIKEETTEEKFKRAIGMMKELEALYVDSGRLTPFKKPKKRV
jgi:DNA-binding transcriptional regulator YdaS (Cro superfamily)